MSLRAPLRNELRRYRRGKPALDGGVPGLTNARATRGISESVVTGHHAQQSHDTEYRALAQPADYDPGHAFYSTEPPNYRPPEAWHDAFAARPTTLITGFDVASAGPPVPAIDQVLAGWLSAHFVNDLPSRAVANAISIEEAIDGIVGPAAGHAGDGAIADIWDHDARPPMYEASALTPELFDQQLGPVDNDPPTLGPTIDDRGEIAESWDQAVDHGGYNSSAITAQMFDHQMEALFGGAPMSEGGFGVDAPGVDPGATGTVDGGPAGALGDPGGFDPLPASPSLEQIVEDEMMQMDPHAMTDPYGMPGGPMDTFGPMPPGLGPIGPAMAPLGPM